ncbi:hypothetical protein IQB76_21370 [Leptospira borgpetersenii serovar Hardjo-bovis]|nr:hypothetical protein [Leptospira borgpetersenii serovar Hardjo-bovis]
MIRFSFLQRQMLLFFGLFFVLNQCMLELESPHVSVVTGVIALSSWNFEKYGPVSLQGDWFFRGKEFVEDPEIIPERNRLMHDHKSRTRI